LGENDTRSAVPIKLPGADPTPQANAPPMVMQDVPDAHRDLPDAYQDLPDAYQDLPDAYIGEANGGTK